jgi:hypothetical protein
MGAGYWIPLFMHTLDHDMPAIIAGRHSGNHTDLMTKFGEPQRLLSKDTFCSTDDSVGRHL